MPTPLVQANKLAAALSARPAAFTVDGVRWTLYELSVVTVEEMPMLRAVLRAVNVSTGAVLIARNSPRNPFYWFNAPTAVPDGDEPNPDHDPSDARSPLRIPKYREDVAEAVRAMLAGLVA